MRRKICCLYSFLHTDALQVLLAVWRNIEVVNKLHVALYQVGTKCDEEVEQHNEHVPV